jgi:hypothetical protein
VGEALSRRSGSFRGLRPLALLASGSDRSPFGSPRAVFLSIRAVRRDPEGTFRPFSSDRRDPEGAFRPHPPARRTPAVGRIAMRPYRPISAERVFRPVQAGTDVMAKIGL